MRVVQLHGEELDFASKYDRSLEQMTLLMRKGERTARDFYDDEKSLWPRCGRTMHGVHQAYLDYPAQHHHQANGEDTGPAFCSTINCPAIGVCNTYVGIPELAKQAFADVQTFLDPHASS